MFECGVIVSKIKVRLKAYNYVEVALDRHVAYQQVKAGVAELVNSDDIPELKPPEPKPQIEYECAAIEPVEQATQPAPKRKNKHASRGKYRSKH